MAYNEWLLASPCGNSPRPVEMFCTPVIGRWLTTVTRWSFCVPTGNHVPAFKDAPMLKPIIIMYPVIPARDEEERAALRPIGRNRDRYQAAIQGMGEIIQAADDMGFWGASTPE